MKQKIEQMQKKELRDSTYRIHGNKICLFPIAKWNQREFMSALHAKFKESKPKMKNNCLHKNK